MNLTKYEQEALTEALTKHIALLETQVKELSKIRHASSEERKEIKRNIEKKILLLKEVLNKSPNL